MSFGLSAETRGVLVHVLGLSQLEDVLDKDYQEVSSNCDVKRDKVLVYGDRNRGSVRLNTGRFYTYGEYEDRISRVKAIPLP